MADDLKTFNVRTACEAQHTRHPIEARDYEEAALAFADQWCSDVDEITLLVTDCESGREHCFVLDVGSGEARAC